MFQDKDLQQIQTRGSELAVVEQQVKNFENGFPFLNVIKAATIGEGIIRLDEQAVKDLRKSL